MNEYYVKVEVPHIIKVKAATPEEATKNALIFLKYPETQPAAVQVLETIELPPIEAIEQQPPQGE